MTRKPTIYEALADKLGREPTAKELKADFDRILQEGLVEMAEKGQIRHQKTGLGITINNLIKKENL